MNISEIYSEIRRLEKADVTWNNIQRLAWLYTVHDHLDADDTVQVRAHTIATIMPDFEGSEFLDAVSSVEIDPLMLLLDEHMQVIRALYPKEYTAIIERLHDMK